jgi:hypothetical protein
MKVHGIHYVRQREIYKAEPFVPDPNRFQAELIIEEYKRYKFQGSDQTSVELAEV